jgi:hypothetical protein
MQAAGRCDICGSYRWRCGYPGCYRPAIDPQASDRETLMSTEAQIRVNRCCLSSSVNRVHLAKMHFQGLKRVKCSRLRRTSRRVLYCIVYYARLRAGQLLYYVLYVLYYITYYIILCIVGPWLGVPCSFLAYLPHLSDYLSPKRTVFADFCLT